MLDNNLQATQDANATYLAANPTIFGGGVQRYTTPTAPATVTPTSTPTGPQPGDVSYTDSNGNVTYYSPGSAGAFDISRGSSPLPVDENAIRESTRKSLQAMIDATNAHYDDLIRQEQVAGAGRNARVQALNVNSGLGGSNFASSQAQQQEDKNTAAVNAINDQRNLDLQGINGKIDEIARGEIAAKKQEAIGNADAYAKYLSDAKDQANQTLQQLAGANVDLSTLDPNKKAYLFKAAGLDPSLGDLVYNSMKPKAAQLDYKYIEQADGSTLAIAPDPKNPGQFIEHTIKGVGPDIGLVLDMIKKYPDAGITPTDDLQTASAKVKSSRIFRKDTYIAPSSNSPTVQPGDNPQLYSGLSSATATAVRAQVGAFKTEPQVQNFATVQDGYNFASSLPTSTTNPADDQALIYALAKVLDPGSVVREGEYATAQKYSQSWIASYGKGISQAINGTGFLSEQARKNIKDTIASKYKATKVTYDNLSKQYANSISTLTGRGDGSAFLKDYTATANTTDPYAEQRAQLHPGEVLVKDAQGNVGAIPEGEFDPSQYTKL